VNAREHDPGDALAAKETLGLMERELDAISESNDSLWAIGAFKALKGSAEAH